MKISKTLRPVRFGAATTNVERGAEMGSACTIVELPRNFFADFPAGSHLRDRQNLETLRLPTFGGPSVPCVAMGELPEQEVVGILDFQKSSLSSSLL